ncbi:hypothetical protein AArcSl_0021 [Halalkaliarchaeum desulfuricum]|uniref:Uncharacterized protein n=1 Tax=Halalkaliarchaeum desulfuricum TaxID=2055893 RepID=A0A343TF07_9EURY|nr:hypothetical protein [Halalkaliarchaeum desulfuricum]AUX07679.1 hypothetical protein AArcSl_0021 [Halalkaliarchaeum desulfuricum]
MTLSDIASGLEVTTSQRKAESRGVATVDGTEATLQERIEPHADELPCTASAAATLLESYERGTSVGESAREAAVAPMTAAKALHRCGVSGICPLAPTKRRIVRDWLAGDISRSEARSLSGADEPEFALATYVETHDPIPALVDAVATADRGRDPAVEKRDALAGTMSDATELR